MSKFSRNWILTENYKSIEPKKTEDLVKEVSELPNIKYYAIVLEEGESGTIHHHIYLSFAQSKTFARLKKLFPRADIQVRKGNHQQMRDYIYKEGEHAEKEDTQIESPIEWGEPPTNQGQRKDLEQIMEMVEEGYTNKEIRECFPTQYFRYNKRIDELRTEIRDEHYKINPRLDINVVYLSDKTGVGKSRYFAEKYGYENFYTVTNYDNPFDHYDGEDVIIFEEFRNDLKLKQMLQILDVHPMKLKARYNDKQACYTKVYIVSNWNFDEQYSWYKENSEEDYNAWLRRIHFKGNLHQVKEYDILQEKKDELDPPF